MKKITVVGGGNAGCFTALYCAWMGQDKDFEVEIRQEVTLPQRITRSKNNIYKKNKKYDEDYV